MWIQGLASRPGFRLSGYPLFWVFVTGLLMISLAAQVGALAFIAVLALLPALFLLLNFRVAFLLLIALIPNLGEVEKSLYLSLLWLLAFAPLLISWLLTLAFRPHEIDIPLIPAFLFSLFLFAAVIAHFGGYDLASLALTREGGAWPYWPVIDAFSSYAIGFIAMTAYRNEKDLRNIYLAFIISGIPYAITIFFVGHEVDPLTGALEAGGRMQGFYGHPHMASTHMIVCAILAANYASYVRGFMRWVSLACTILFLATLGFATSKTTMAALPVIMFLWVALTFDFKRALVAVGGALVFIVVLYPALPGTIKRDVGTIAEVFVGDDTPHSRTLPGEGRLNTLKVRYIQIEEGIDLIREQPWIGYGPGRVVYVSKIPARFAGPQIHNYYVQVFFEVGIIGGVLFLAFIMTVLGLGSINMSALRGKRAWFLVRGLLLASVMLALIVALNSSSVGLRIIWCIFGLLAGTERLARSPAT